MKIALRIAASLLVAATLIALLLHWSNTDVRAVVATLGELEIGLYGAAVGVQALIYVMRALRFRALLPRAMSPSFARLLPVTASHILAANVLPAKIGEASLVLYLRRTGGVPAAHGLAVLLVSRILDFATLTGCLALACLTLDAAGTFPELDGLGALGLALVVPAVLFGWLAARGEHVVAFAAGAVRLLRIDRTRLGDRLLQLAQRLRAALGDVTARQLLLGAFATLPVWLGVFAFYAILARGFGVELPFAALVFGAGLAILSTLLPVNGFGGFGVQDMGWVAGFTALGVGRELAVESGLAAHLVYLFNIAAFGLAGHVAMAILGKRTAER